MELKPGSGLVQHAKLDTRSNALQLMPNLTRLLPSAVVTTPHGCMFAIVLLCMLLLCYHARLQSCLALGTGTQS